MWLVFPSLDGFREIQDINGNQGLSMSSHQNPPNIRVSRFPVNGSLRPIQFFPDLPRSSGQVTYASPFMLTTPGLVHCLRTGWPGACHDKWLLHMAMEALPIYVYHLVPACYIIWIMCCCVLNHQTLEADTFEHSICRLLESFVWGWSDWEWIDSGALDSHGKSKGVTCNNCPDSKPLHPNPNM